MNGEIRAAAGFLLVGLLGAVATVYVPALGAFLAAFLMAVSVGLFFTLNAVVPVADRLENRFLGGWSTGLVVSIVAGGTLAFVVTADGRWVGVIGRAVLLFVVVVAVLVPALSHLVPEL